MTSGLHKVEVSWTGQKGVAGGTRINIDALDVTGTLSPVDLGTVTVEQSDTHLVYAGVWTTLSDPVYSGGSTAYANSAGSSVTVHFTGSYLALVALSCLLYSTVAMLVALLLFEDRDRQGDRGRWDAGDGGPL